MPIAARPAKCRPAALKPRKAISPCSSIAAQLARVPAEETASSWRALLGRTHEAFRMALLAMKAHQLLGIIIGIASVVSVVALGTGAQQKVLANISSLGTNTLEIFPGKDFVDLRGGEAAHPEAACAAASTAAAASSKVASGTPRRNNKLTRRSARNPTPVYMRPSPAT
jgi:macrolide transport system ATP-binding/permease protein